MSDVHLEHAFLYVRDLDKSLAFYRGLFPDWTIRWEGKHSANRRWIHWGPSEEGQPGYLSLCEHHDPQAREADGDGLTIAHVGFAHPDLNALLARLAPLGIRPRERAADGGFHRAYFVDPDGHDLEFVQRLG